TGTNGKTTSTFLLGAIARAAGRTPAVIGTLGMFLPNGPRPHSRTTPEAPELQAAFADARNAGADLVAMEVSSHALDLRRVDGTSFAAAAFLNLSAEHLDWHGTMERYGASKMRLFAELLAEGRTAAGHPRAALNGMDPWADRFREVVKDAVVFATGEDRAAEVTARGLRIAPGGSRFDLVTPDGVAAVELSLPGRHNVENALAAAAVAWSLGIATDAIARGLSAAEAPPGRFERVHAGTFDAYVDYAHTEDALALALEAARAVTRGRLFVVLGCGGNRDKAKRPGMGRIAAAGADVAIFTTDNPRDEDPIAIVEAMRSGVADWSRVEVVMDREEALARAVALAGPGDVVLACGKGHEEYQEIGGERLPFPERRILGRLSAECDGAAR
ncbi:UDP-N-acetylmuramoyl-L-alanyl-D-glutamate--2,6-diaminopimelate ligase, partial [bacterium]|nr:UDP-N-acetylmuramoyl-L-alanyl-D-glutamate--2,6-diaminopimelate ligase [bacterium]